MLSLLNYFNETSKIRSHEIKDRHIFIFISLYIKNTAIPYVNVYFYII